MLLVMYCISCKMLKVLFWNLFVFFKCLYCREIEFLSVYTQIEKLEEAC